MEELLLQLLLALVEIFADAVLQFAGEAVVGLLSRALVRVFSTSLKVNPALAAAGYTLLGALAGAASVAVLPHPLVRPSRFHGISLLISPTLVGLTMSWIGSSLKKQGKATAQIETFGFGFAFAFGMALIRLLFVK